MEIACFVAQLDSPKMAIKVIKMFFFMVLELCSHNSPMKAIK